ncbi:MAG: phage distal tail protein, partial [Peptostreptococcaceae bacterium]
DPEYEKGTITSGSRTEFYQVVCTALNVRTGPSTKYKKVRCLVKGNKITPLEWKGSWARIGNNEWCCCNTAYVQKKYEDTTVVTTTSRTLKNFHTTTKAEILRVANPKGFVECSVASGTILRLESSKVYYEPEKVEEGQTPDQPGGNNEYYYKLAKSYNGYWGYVKVGNVKVANNVVYEYAEELETADDKTGVVEVYGYSANNEQLFKLSMVDDNEYYSFNYPDITVCGKTFLKDNNVAPAPKVSSETSGSDDKLTVKQEYILSGAYGDWNNFYGKIGITRKDNYYQAWVVKMKGGQVVKQLFSPTKSVSNATKSKLSYITVYIGTSNKDNSKASGMSVEHISVKNLNPSNPATQNIKKFQAGDILKVDCFNNQVWLNDVRYNKFEIGSQFFPLELGENIIKVASDDGEVHTSVIFNEQYL